MGLIKNLSNVISKRMKVFVVACAMALGTVCAVQSVCVTPIHAVEQGSVRDTDYNTPPPTEYEEPEYVEGIEYNENGALEQLMVGMYDVQITLFGVDINFNNLGKSMDDFLDFDGMKNTSTGTHSRINLYDFFKNTIYPTVQGMGISLLTMMMMWKFIKECLEVERFSWERAMMLVARTIIVNMFIVNAFQILEIFFGFVMELFDKILFQDPNGAPIKNIGEVFAAGITEDPNPISKCMIAVVGMIMSFLYYGTCIAIISQVIVRYVKILVGMSFAPIPMALSVDEQHGTDVLRYVFWMTGCFLQAPIMKACFYIYNLLLSEAGWQIASGASDFSLWSMIPVCLLISIVNGLLAMMLNMAQQVTDRIMPA